MRVTTDDLFRKIGVLVIEKDLLLKEIEALERAVGVRTDPIEEPQEALVDPKSAKEGK